MYHDRNLVHNWYLAAVGRKRGEEACVHAMSFESQQRDINQLHLTATQKTCSSRLPGTLQEGCPQAPRLFIPWGQQPSTRLPAKAKHPETGGTSAWPGGRLTIDERLLKRQTTCGGAGQKADHSRDALLAADQGWWLTWPLLLMLLAVGL